MTHLEHFIKPAAALRWFLVNDRQRPDDALRPGGDPGGGKGAVSEELGRMEGVGEVGRDALR